MKRVLWMPTAFRGVVGLTALFAVQGLPPALANRCNPTIEVCPPPPLGSIDEPSVFAYLKGTPRDDADVLGRDLNFPGLGALGHVGLFNDSQQLVLEMLDEPIALQANLISNFRQRTTYWGAGFYKGAFSYPTAPLCIQAPNCPSTIRNPDM